jgi:predicted MFS family arabinose efflux permease
LIDLLADRRIRRLSAIYFCCVMGQYGITFWLPTLLAATGHNSPLMIGMLSALPYGAAVLTMILVSRHSDITGERRWHLAAPLLVGAAALASAPLVGGQFALTLSALTVAAAATLTATPLFWNLPTAALTGMAAAVGIAVINSVGNLAGFLSPLVVGWISERFASTDAGLVVLASVLAGGAALVLLDRAPAEA